MNKRMNGVGVLELLENNEMKTLNNRVNTSDSELTKHDIHNAEKLPRKQCSARK